MTKMNMCAHTLHYSAVQRLTCLLWRQAAEGKRQLCHITSWVPDFPGCPSPPSSSVKWENGVYWPLLKAQCTHTVGAGDPTPRLGVVIVLRPHLPSYTLTLLASRTPLSLGVPPKSPAMARALSSDRCAPSQGSPGASNSFNPLSSQTSTSSQTSSALRAHKPRGLHGICGSWLPPSLKPPTLSQGPCPLPLAQRGQIPGSFLSLTPHIHFIRRQSRDLTPSHHRPLPAVHTTITAPLD